MWWNFVARTGDEIVASRAEWQAELAGTRPSPAARVPRSAACPASAARRSPLRRCPRRRCARGDVSAEVCVVHSGSAPRAGR